MDQDPKRSSDNFKTIVDDFSNRFRYAAYDQYGLEDSASDTEFDQFDSSQHSTSRKSKENGYSHRNARDDHTRKRSSQTKWIGLLGDNSEVFYLEPESPLSPRKRSSKSHSSSKANNEAQPSRNRPGISSKVKQFISPRSKDGHSNGTLDGTPERLQRREWKKKQNQLSVSFKDKPTGVIRQVWLWVDPNRTNLGRRSSMCEKLFGIIPGNFGTQSADQTLNSSGTKTIDTRIMVLGIIPGSIAMKSKQVKIGDWLMQVNDLDINLENCDSILSAISTPREVKLTFQKLAVQAPLHSPTTPSVAIKENLVRLISRQTNYEDKDPMMMLADVPCAATCLSLNFDSESDNPSEGVLYSYSRGGLDMTKLSGLFLTLATMCPDISGDAVKCTTVLFNDEYLHVAYFREESHLFLLALPKSRTLENQLMSITQNITRILKVLYGSLKSALGNPDNHPQMDRLFILTLQRHLLAEEMLDKPEQTEHLEPFYDVLSGVRCLVLPEATRLTISNCLSELESADFADMSDDHFGLKRMFNILGSSLFYKGYLIANHLAKDDLCDLTLFLHFNCILTLSQYQQLGQLLLWREVFPWRRCHCHSEPLIPGYTESYGRFFFMVVGMKNYILGVLLQACSDSGFQPLSPDAFYVDQAKASLNQILVSDAHIQCEARMQSPPVPSLACVDWFMGPTLTKLVSQEEGKLPQSPLSLKSLGSPRIITPKKILHPESILKKSPSISSDTPPRRGLAFDMESDNDSMSTVTSENSTPAVDNHRRHSIGSEDSLESGSSISLFKSGRRRNMLSVQNLIRMRENHGESYDPIGTFVKLPVGCENTLFHFVHFDSLEGLYLCPSQQELSQVVTEKQRELLTNFHQACLRIHSVLHSNAKHSSQELPFSHPSPSEMTEHGVLFEIPAQKVPDGKKEAQPLHYWVLGRLLTKPKIREFYVCFHDSAHQNSIELAFQLGLGLVI